MVADLIDVPWWRKVRRQAWALQRRDQPELLDGFSWSPDELRTNLRDIRRVNRLGGGTSAIIRELPRLLRDLPRDQEITVLDLATGSADIPLAVVEWARREQRRVAIVASDWSEDILCEARRRAEGRPEITFAALDARSTDLPDRSFDLVLCSLALHHFSPDDAVAVLREMQRLARIGTIVNDLARCRTGYLAAIVTSRLLTRNRLTRNDAPLSVLRAYTQGEMRGLLERAGYHDATVKRRPLFRLVAVWKRP